MRTGEITAIPFFKDSHIKTSPQRSHIKDPISKPPLPPFPLNASALVSRPCPSAAKFPIFSLGPLSFRQLATKARSSCNQKPRGLIRPATTVCLVSSLTPPSTGPALSRNTTPIFTRPIDSPNKNDQNQRSPILEQSKNKPSFRPLEYWKPPKAVQHQTIKSKKGSQGLSLSLQNILVEVVEYPTDRKEMSFATIEDMNTRRKHPYSENIGMVGESTSHMGPHKFDREDTLNPSPWDIRHWSWKKWAMLIAGVVIIIVIIVVVVVEVTKKNKYPDYSALTYSLADTCTSPLSHSPHPILTPSRLRDFLLRQLRLLHRL